MKKEEFRVTSQTQQGRKWQGGVEYKLKAKFATHSPDQPYIVIHDLPKVENLRKQFPELYTAK